MADATPTSVYLYYDELDILLYVGVTSRGMRRQVEHNRSKDWWRYVVRQEVEHFDTRDEALSRETELIITFRPPFNQQQNPTSQQELALYLTARSLMDPRDPQTVLRETKYTMPLDLLYQDSETCALVTPVKYAQAVALIEWSGQPKAVVHTTPCGHMTAYRRVGARAVFHLRVQRGATVTEPFVRFKMHLGKSGPRFSVRSFQLAP